MKIERDNNLPFQNEPLRDFSRKEERESLAREFETIRKELPLHCNPVISGKSKNSGIEVFWSNPADLSETIAKIRYASIDEAEEAVSEASLYFGFWKNEKPNIRIEILKKTAQLLRLNKNRLSVLLTLEVGKGTKDADAEIAEAIDFCEFYAEEAEKIFEPRKRNLPGEENTYSYVPRGTTLVVAPWNFPLAILCGMTVAPLVVGNTVIMKPARTIFDNRI